MLRAFGSCGMRLRLMFRRVRKELRYDPWVLFVSLDTRSTLKTTPISVGFNKKSFCCYVSRSGLYLDIQCEH